MIFGKIRSAGYKNIEPHYTSRDEWYIHENTHEPLVSREDFDAVQALIEERGRRVSEKKKSGVSQCTDRFHLKVKCRECGRTMMYFPKYRHIEAMTADYKCYAAGNCGDTSTGCGVRAVGKKYNGCLTVDGRRRDCGKKVHEDFVRIVVLDNIHNLLHYAADLKEMTAQLYHGEGKLAQLQREKIRLREEFATVQARIEGLYSDFVSGLLEMQDYQELKEHYILQKHDLNEKISLIDAEIRTADKKLKDLLEWANKCENVILDETTEQSLFDELIDTIYISDDKSVEIVFKCSDMISEMQEILGGE